MHPGEGHELFAVVDDIKSLVASMRSRGVACSDPSEAPSSPSSRLAWDVEHLGFREARRFENPGIAVLARDGGHLHLGEVAAPTPGGS